MQYISYTLSYSTLLSLYPPISLSLLSFIYIYIAIDISLTRSLPLYLSLSIYPLYILIYIYIYIYLPTHYLYLSRCISIMTSSANTIHPHTQMLSQVLTMVPFEILVAMSYALPVRNMRALCILYIGAKVQANCIHLLSSYHVTTSIRSAVTPPLYVLYYPTSYYTTYIYVNILLSVMTVSYVFNYLSCHVVLMYNTDLDPQSELYYTEDRDTNVLIEDRIMAKLRVAVGDSDKEEEESGECEKPEIKVMSKRSSRQITKSPKLKRSSTRIIPEHKRRIMINEVTGKMQLIPDKLLPEDKAPEKLTFFSDKAPEKLPVLSDKVPEKLTVLKDKAPEKLPVISDKAPEKLPVLSDKAPEKLTVLKDKAPEKLPVLSDKAPEKLTVLKDKAPEKLPVLSDKAPEKLPVLSDKAPEKLTVLKDKAPEKLPVLSDKAPEKLPVLSDKAPEKLTVLKDKAPDKLPVISDKAPEKLPVLSDKAPEKLTVLKDKAPDKLPVISDKAPEKLPVISDKAHEKLPVLSDKAPEKLPVLSDKAPEKLIVLKDKAPDKLPVISDKAPEKLSVLSDKAPEKFSVLSDKAPEKLSVISDKVPEKLSVLSDKASEKFLVLSDNASKKFTVLSENANRKRETYRSFRKSFSKYEKYSSSEVVQHSCTDILVDNANTVAMDTTGLTRLGPYDIDADTMNNNRNHVISSPVAFIVTCDQTRDTPLRHPAREDITPCPVVKHCYWIPVDDIRLARVRLGPANRNRRDKLNSSIMYIF